MYKTKPDIARLPLHAVPPRAISRNPSSGSSQSAFQTTAKNFHTGPDSSATSTGNWLAQHGAPMDQEYNSALLTLSPVPCPRLVLSTILTTSAVPDRVNRNHPLACFSAPALLLLDSTSVSQSMPCLPTSSAAHSYQVSFTIMRPTASIVCRNLNVHRYF